ncbi:hypothetical protein CF168_19255 [Shewanella bicestrii]|uniref:Uncharacterized protein n=2 Tax=Shewanellaceae TaxID=267890 RepID=A0A220UT18_9GAMM|nr:hypothetical protein CF168_19255 [Shewanella bicestrii]QYK09481.1 hypothetical protein K0H60_01905 [Shewanella mangrovisoli]
MREEVRMTTKCPRPTSGEQLPEPKVVREARYSVSRNRGQASTKVRYIETSAMSLGCKLCE